MRQRTVRTDTQIYGGRRSRTSPRVLSTLTTMTVPFRRQYATAVTHIGLYSGVVRMPRALPLADCRNRSANRSAINIRQRRRTDTGRDISTYMLFFCCCCQVAFRQGRSWRHPGNNFCSTRKCQEMTTAHASLAASSSFRNQMGQKVTERDLTKIHLFSISLMQDKRPPTVCPLLSSHD